MAFSVELNLTVQLISSGLLKRIDALMIANHKENRSQRANDYKWPSDCFPPPSDSS